MNKLFKILVPVLFLFSCGNNNPTQVISNEALVSYFQTNDVDIRKQNNRFEISVTNSQLVKNEKEKKGRNWLSAEPFASIGALIFYDQIKNNPVVTDSIFFNIENGINIETYQYKVSDLKKIKKLSDTCSYFFNRISNQDYLSAKKVLGSQILDASKSGQLDSFLKLLSSQGKVTKSELIAFTIDDKLISLYMNVYFENGKAQTYICNFYKEGNGHIEGFSEPS